MSTLAELTEACVTSGGWGSVEQWLQVNSRPVARVGTMLTEIRRAESYNLTTLSVALRQLRNLALTASPAPDRPPARARDFHRQIRSI